MDFTNIGNDFNIYNMKYLKRFNESVDKSNIEEIKQTIKDILLPISDMGYEISITDDRNLDADPTYFIRTGKFYIRVVSYTDTPLKMNDEVTDEFIRMKEYLESSGFNSVESIYVREGSNYRFEEDFNEFIILEEVILRNLLFVAKVN
jgi:hypothetical protein